MHQIVDLKSEGSTPFDTALGTLAQMVERRREVPKEAVRYRYVPQSQ